MGKYTPEEIGEAMENPKVGDLWKIGSPDDIVAPSNVRVMRVTSKTVKLRVNGDFISVRTRLQFLRMLMRSEKTLLAGGRDVLGYDAEEVADALENPKIGDVWNLGDQEGSFVEVLKVGKESVQVRVTYDSKAKRGPGGFLKSITDGKATLTKRRGF